MWGGAVIGGLVAGIAMGLIMHFVMGAMPLIGALYGRPTVVAGWVAHLIHSVVFALIFAAIVTNTRLREYGFLGTIGLGAVYGLVLEFGAAGLVLPLWANAVAGANLPVPFLVPIGFATHLVYGAVLGAVFGYTVAHQRSATVDAAAPPAA